jgi:hypothetical protein
MSRLVAAIVSIAFVAIVLEPVVRAPADDGFPLSTFPMFARPRPARVAVSYARGFTADGRSRELRPAHLGTGEVMQAFVMLQRAVDAGPAARQALCVAIAARVAADARYRDVTAIRILGGWHDAVEFVAAGMRGEATGEVTHARCDVARAPR